GCFNPNASNHSLYLIKLITRYCYPEGNFGRNQLPDGSISLSPLYPNLTIDLHVRTAASLHQSFLWLRPIQAEFTIFRVPTATLLLESIRRHQDRSIVRPARGFRPPFASTARTGLPPAHSRRCGTPWSQVQDGSCRTITPAAVPKRVPRSRQAAFHPGL